MSQTQDCGWTNHGRNDFVRLQLFVCWPVKGHSPPPSPKPTRLSLLRSPPPSDIKRITQLILCRLTATQIKKEVCDAYLPWIIVAHLLQSVSLCCHVHLQSVKRSFDLTHGQFHGLHLKLQSVGVSLFEARWLIVLRSDCERFTQTDSLLCVMTQRCLTKTCSSCVDFVCATVVVVGQLHVEEDVVWQRTQVLHQCVELPYQQDAGLLGVTARHCWHLAVVVVVLAGSDRKQG